MLPRTRKMMTFYKDKYSDSRKSLSITSVLDNSQKSIEIILELSRSKFFSLSIPVWVAALSQSPKEIQAH